MSKELKTDVVVIGAGISGLASAHFLKKVGFETIVLEKNNRPGGAIRTRVSNGFLIEYGPNSTLDTSPIIHEFFSDLGIEKDMEYANDQSKNRYIVRYGTLNALPMSPGAFLKSKLFSTGAKLRLVKEPFIKAVDADIEENLAQFVLRRLGQEFLDYAIDPFVAGVYAGLPEHLSVKSAFPKLHALEQKYGSLIKGTILGARERKKSREVSKQSAKLFSFRKGMQTMINAAQAELGNRLLLGCRIDSLEKNNGTCIVNVSSAGGDYDITCSNILMTIPAYEYESLGLNIFKPILPILAKMYHPPVTMVYFGYNSNPANRCLDGFGFLIPRKENMQILGTIWSSTIFQDRAPKNGIALTTFVGGSRNPENALLSEEKIVDLVKNDLKQLMGIEQNPDLVSVQGWPTAIPQYKIGHQKIIDELIAFEKKNRSIYISGNFRGGISVGDCIKQAKAMAQQIHDENNQKLAQ